MKDGESSAHDAGAHGDKAAIDGTGSAASRKLTDEMELPLRRHPEHHQHLQSYAKADWPSERRPSTIEEALDGEDELRNAHIAAGKAFSILKKMEMLGFCGVERSSVYGAAIAIPQVARSVGWSKTLLGLTLRSYLFLFINFCIQGFLLTYIGQAIVIINPNAGQMHLCDFGASLTSWTQTCPGGPNCIGPHGTEMTLPRLYGYDTWATRSFVQASLIALFPERREEIEQKVDPGEYGVENYVCRVVCLFIFTLSVVEDLRSTFGLVYLLWKLPSIPENWISWSPPDWAEKSHAKAVHGWTELDLVSFQVAGMPRHWKFINFFLICCPKLILWYGTVHAGFQFLFETSAIDDLVINCVAMTFLLEIDEMIFDRLTTVATKYIMANLEDYPLFTTEEEDHETDEEVLDRFRRHEEISHATHIMEICLWIFSKHLVLVLIVMGFFTCEYYYRNCVRFEGGYVSKPMFLPEVSSANLLSFLFGSVPQQSSQAFWTMPNRSEAR